MDLNKVSSYSAAVFDRIKTVAKNATVTAVSATVNAVGAVGSLIGNPLTKDFDVGKHVASFGPNLAWKIYEGKKKTTGQEVSLVVFEKRLLDKVDKRDRDFVMETMKKGPVQLTRLRHPRLLVVQHPLEESKDCLAFATEPIFASLANLLGKHDNMPSPLPDDFKMFELYDVERVYGLFQLVEGLTFLHNDAKILQASLAPELICVTKNGQWKIAGLFFSSTPVVIDGQLIKVGKQLTPHQEITHLLKPQTNGTMEPPGVNDNGSRFPDVNDDGSRFLGKSNPLQTRKEDDTILSKVAKAKGKTCGKNVKTAKCAEEQDNKLTDSFKIMI